MRKPDAVTYELGHWEAMQIATGLMSRADELENLIDFVEDKAVLRLNIKQVRDLARIFNDGTVSITKKVEEQ